MRVRISELPHPVSSDINAMVVESEQSGFRFLRRLLVDWESGINRFQRPGEALFGAYEQTGLVGICGLNVDPYSTDPRLGRIRHLYVLKLFRNRGIGRQLVERAIKSACGSFDRLHLRTDDPNATRFYEHIGFGRCLDAGDFTHAIDLRGNRRTPVVETSSI